MDALFGAWLVEDDCGVIIRSSTSRAEAIHVGAHIVIAELADLEVGNKGSVLIRERVWM